VARADTSIVPLVAVSSPDASRSSVDLPHPDGPTTVTNSPASMDRLTSVSATVPVGNRLVTPWSASVRVRSAMSVVTVATSPR
jgi:hypothetical protein